MQKDPQIAKRRVQSFQTSFSWCLCSSHLFSPFSTLLCFCFCSCLSGLTLLFSTLLQPSLSLSWHSYLILFFPSSSSLCLFSSLHFPSLCHCKFSTEHQKCMQARGSNTDSAHSACNAMLWQCDNAIVERVTVTAELCLSGADPACKACPVATATCRENGG